MQMTSAILNAGLKKFSQIDEIDAAETIPSLDLISIEYAG